jgi:hypothetical protein
MSAAQRDSPRPTHYIRLAFNTSGFNGNDLNLALPTFMSERATTVGLTWWPSAHGPEFYTLLIVASGIASAVATSFFSELGKDLYAWSKDRLNNLLSAKRFPVGQITLRSDDCELVAYLEGKAEIDEAVLALVALAARRPSTATGTYHVDFDPANDSWIAAPAPKQISAGGEPFSVRRTEVLAFGGSKGRDGH